MRVKFTASARGQFLEALQYIRQVKPSAAHQFRVRAEEVLRRLEQFPASGRAIPEFTVLPHREVIVPPYRFFYRVVGQTVWIVAIWHGAQIPSEPPN